jgi:hypothetical protein
LSLAKGLPVDVADLKRLYYDSVGCASLSLAEIGSILEQARHVHASVDSYYYHAGREELIADYYKRFAAMQKVLRGVE